MQYFEDITVDEVQVIGRHCVSKEEIVRFASEWDPLPFHIDEEAAKKSVFKGLTASSCHTYSITARIFSQVTNKLAAGAMMGLEMRFPTPVRPGDELTMSTVCTDKRLSKSRPELGVINSRATLVNQKGEEACVIDSSYLVYCKPDNEKAS